MRRQHILFIVNILLFTLFGFFKPANLVHSEAPDQGSPISIYIPLIHSPEKFTVVVQPEQQEKLEAFIRSVEDGQADVIRGIYAAGLLAQPVVQQPEGSPTYISTGEEDITQFGLAGQLGVIGLLAHIDRSGKKFANLMEQEQVQVVYGDGSFQTYRITAVDRYQALDPDNPYSSFTNLSTGELLSSDQVFLMYYTRNGTLTFQTCISRNNNPSWGRLFITAEPIS